jgi:hypothetical protein
VNSTLFRQKSRCFFRTWYSPDDKPHKVCERSLPLINERLLECVCYLYKNTEDAKEGAQIGGSGFLVGIPIANQERGFLVVVVTNKHNIEAGGRVVRMTTYLPSKTSYPIQAPLEEWIYHPDGDDLAIYPYEVDFGLANYKYLHANKHLMTIERVKEKSLGPGDDVFLIGRFINHDGKQHNVPSARFGHIAQMPGVPITINGYDHEAFLIECRSISGFSGAPVFVHMLNNAARTANRVTMESALGPWLLGIDFCHIRSKEKVEDPSGNVVGSVEVNTGMSGIIPAWRLTEMFELPALKAAMKQKLDEANESGITLD